jgi:hypothetical protein
MHPVAPVAVLVSACCLAGPAPSYAGSISEGSCSVGRSGSCAYVGQDGGDKRLSVVVRSASYQVETWRASLVCLPGEPGSVTLEVTLAAPGIVARSTAFHRSATSACVLTLGQVRGTSMSTAAASAN